MPISKRYWDSNVFLGWLTPENDKQEACLGVIKAAEKGDVKIVTSALTIAEVIYLKTYPKIAPEESEKIKAFFENDFILLINVDRRLAENARDLLWEYTALKPKDAIHVASAIKAKVPRIDTFDGDLIGLDGQIGTPPIRIGKPDLPYQNQKELFEE